MKIFLKGEEPPSGDKWCAICVMEFMGVVATDETQMQAVRDLVKKYEDTRKDWVTFVLPTNPLMPLNLAVTVAPSYAFPTVPLPVCWMHVQGIPPQDERIKQAKPGAPGSSPLILGKKYEVPR